MAGIGFELKRAVHEASYIGTLRGYLYAAVISSGPWLLSVFTLALLGLISVAFLPSQARDLIAATATHSFAISLITTGFIQLFVTRYLADRLYLNDTEAVVPTFVSVLTLSSIVQFVVMALLLSRLSTPLDYRLPAIALYVGVSGIWLAMVFLSAARDYLAIVSAFVIGYAVSFIVALSLGRLLGPSGYLAGLATGQVTLLALLIARVLAEFEAKESFSLTVFTYARRYPALLAIGVIYSVAFWIDKIAFWYSPEGVSVNSVLNVFPPYDSSFFLATLTIVPALAIFVVNIETDFYNHYRDFYQGIMNKRGFGEIVAAKDGMVRSARASYVTLFKIQGAIALLVIAFAPSILGALGTPQSQWYMFRIAVLAMGVQVFLIHTLMVLLYLDLRGSVLIVSTVFLVSNLAFTVGSMQLGYAFYGYGFLYASVLSLVVAVPLLRNRFDRLEYLTFTRQPLIPQA